MAFRNFTKFSNNAKHILVHPVVPVFYVT